MNHSTRFLIFFASIVFGNCTSEPTDNDRIDTLPDSGAINMSIDTLQEKETSDKNKSSLRPITNWKTSDFIIATQYKSSESVKRTIENEIEEWKDVKSPFVATYKGCDMGDYFHLIFEDSTGKTYDFGFGNNQLEKFELCDMDITDNSKYLGKSFVIYWNWEISKFPCCDGEYDLVEAYMPSITKLELR